MHPPIEVFPLQDVQVAQCGQWHRARVLEVSEDGSECLVHYWGWNARWDEYVPLDSGRIRPPPPKTRSPRNHASSSAADAAKRATHAAEDDEPHADCEGWEDEDPAAQGSASVSGAGKRKAREAGLPEGWEMAAAAETLRECGDRKLFAADWFHAFSAHAITKRSGLSAEKLLPRFVVALNDLQTLGLCQASKQPRGTVEKRVFG